jgi:hypothetical protein
MQISKGANPKSKSTGSLTGWNGTWRLRSTPQICPTPATLARSDSPGRPLYHRQAWGACGLFLDEKGKLVGRKLYETDNQSNLKSNRYPKDPTPQAKTKVEFLFRAFVSQSKIQMRCVDPKGRIQLNIWKNGCGKPPCFLHHFFASVILVCCISHFKRIKYTSAHIDI